MGAFNLRMPLEVKLALQRAAKENGRSLNAEIVWRLLRSLDGYRR
jgi:predicted HicB family RNase H-like nuclease